MNHVLVQSWTISESLIATESRILANLTMQTESSTEDVRKCSTYDYKHCVTIYYAGNTYKKRKNYELAVGYKCRNKY